MKKMLTSKKVISISLCLLMLVMVASYGFALNNGDRKDVKNPKVEINKMYDSNKDKVFENLSKKMNDSDKHENLPVIVIFKDKVSKSEKKNIDTLLGSYKLKHEFKNIPGMALKLNKNQIEKLSKLNIVDHIEYDEVIKAVNDDATYWFGADKAKNDFNVDGNRDGNLSSYSKDDVVVAVIDTGIDGNHVDLDGGQIIGWKDYVNNQSSPYDDEGHGTHCAGIIAGQGDGNSIYEGVAKGTALVGIKALDNQGSGSMSDVTAAIDWCVTNKDVYGIDIISMSLSADGSSDGTDACSVAANNAVDNGIVVVVAAGNEGSSKYTIGSPSAAEKAITVAAMADVGELGFNLAYFSSRGPTADERIKPDISAPGWDITAPKANTTNSYVAKSGTSMATPFTAGTISLMLDADTTLTPTQVKNIISTTAHDWGPTGKDIDYGYGRLDAYECIKQSGGYTGTNINVPDHEYKSETLDSDNARDKWEFTVTDTSSPIAATVIITDWIETGWGWWTSGEPDFDVYLYDPNGNQVDSSTGVERQETVNYQPTQTGTYRIEIYSYSGTGNYFFDMSLDGGSFTLTQDQ